MSTSCHVRPRTLNLLLSLHQSMVDIELESLLSSSLSSSIGPKTPSATPVSKSASGAFVNLARRSGTLTVFSSSSELSIGSVVHKLSSWSISQFGVSSTEEPELELETEGT